MSDEGEQRHKGVSAEAFAVLKGMADGGRLTPENVVKEAKRRGSPLRDYFTWDDSEAARCWRIEQAKHLIRRVRVVVIQGPQEPVRAFVNLTSDRKPGQGGVAGDGLYRPIERVLDDSALRAQLVEDAMHEMRAFKNKYARLTELNEVFAAMDQAIQRHADKKVTNNKRPAVAGAGR